MMIFYPQNPEFYKYFLDWIIRTPQPNKTYRTIEESLYHTFRESIPPSVVGSTRTVRLILRDNLSGSRLRQQFSINTLPELQEFIDKYGAENLWNAGRRSGPIIEKLLEQFIREYNYYKYEYGYF